jgi:hypothetical protein
MKKFNRDSFLSELGQRPWENVYHYEDPNVMWATWKDLLPRSYYRKGNAAFRRKVLGIDNTKKLHLLYCLIL